MSIRPFVAATLVALSSAAAAQKVHIDPSECVLSLDPGEFAQVSIEVCIPGQSVDKADIYLLADTTTSMQPVLDQIAADAQALVSTLLNNGQVDVQVGVGRYRDFPFDDPPFEHQQPISSDEQALVGAIDTWTAGGGGDGSEGQLYALHRLVNEPSIGWRPGSKRIVVLFGDSPAHDPICDTFMAFVGEPGVTLTESSVTAELIDAGPFGGTTVVMIGVPTGYVQALNDDPLLSAEDYTVLLCAQDGTPGQADRIAAATAGLSSDITDPAQITNEILTTIEMILNQVEVKVVADGDIDVFVSDIQPPLYEVDLPQSSTEEVCVTFTISLSADTGCSENQHTFQGELQVLLNGQVAATKAVTVNQPLCDTSMCLMYLGVEPTSLGLPGGTSADLLYTHPLCTFPVLLDSIPVFKIPNRPIYDGLSVYFQVVMSNSFDFPNDPIKASNGLQVVLGQGSQTYGTSSGIQLWLVDPPLLGGVLKTQFSIDGF
ncbi:MAG: VWA domain-containing protein [Planctomycetes bacterium]|nr:VWA domain-containing protein [Planctomycetota bacterium]